jgi:tRNA-splicing ligase RtcB
MMRYCSTGYGLWDELINRNHNHAENVHVLPTWHSGVSRGNFWIHRKGATHAELGMMGVIPGNMKDGSFIVRGKGNPESLYSSSHGAGRVMGRADAEKILRLADFEKDMDGVKALVCQGTLDESRGAYKDIFAVMRQQEPWSILWHTCDH